ncbi:phage tail tube protein [Streptomyces sp. DW26H14]|uniref:phage tail tube protein n=1 Tax=Streptomyces sp. DW26H14 TaxID=3435395 RepID=UPI00403DF61C
MTATPIQQATRYFAPGISKVLWVPTIANPSAPTRAELDAGTDLSGEVNAIDGWTVTADTADTPDLNSTFVGKLPTTTSADDSSITFYASQDGQDVRTLLSRNERGNVVWMDEGDDPSQVMDVFPVMVSSNAKQRSMSDPALIQVTFVVTRQPAENVSIPAAA